MIAKLPIPLHIYHGSFTTNRQGTILHVSNDLLILCGYNMHELQNKPFTFLFPEYAQPLVFERHLDSFNSRKEETEEYYLLDKYGKLTPVLINSIVAANDDETALRFNAVSLKGKTNNLLQDRMNGKEFSDTLTSIVDVGKRAEEELEMLVNNTEESFVFTDTAFNIIRFNRQFFNLYEIFFNREVKYGENILNYATTENRGKIEDLYQKVLQGQTIETEIKVGNAETLPHIFYLKYKPVKNEHKEIIGVFVSATDITEKRKLEEARVAGKKRYKALIENGADGVAILSLAGKPLYQSSSIKKILGYTIDEYARLDIFSITHAYDLDKFSQVWGTVLNSPGIPVHAPAIRTHHRNGSWVWLQNTFTNMLHEPSIGGVIDNFSDITEIVNANEELQQKQFHIELAETNYREIFEKANDGIFIYQIETGLLAEVNTKACELLGCSKDQLMNSARKNFEADLPGFGVRVAMEKFQKAVSGKPQLFEWLIKRSDGTNSWMEVSLKRATIAGADRILAFFRQIDSRKKAEVELEKLSQIARETNNSVVITDIEGRIQWVNEAFTRITEYELNEVIGRKPKDFLQGPETSSVAKRYMRIKIFKGHPYKCDIVNYAKSGRKYWIRIECQPRLNDEGALIGFFAMQTDITKEKEAEDFVKLSEEKYRSLFDFNPSCIIIWDPNTLKILEVNSKATETYKYSKEEFLTMSSTQLRPTSDVARIKDVARKFIENDNYSYNGVWEHIDKHGEAMPMKYVSHAIIYNGRKAILAMGDNIKEKIKLEKALEEERAKRHFEITEAVLSTQEKERKEIGEELHDNVNQILAGAILYLGLSRKEINRKIPFLDETEKLLNSAIYELRNISHNLIPPRLPELSLEDSLENVIKITEHSGIKIHRDFVHIEENAVSAKLKLAIYRIVQEHFSNIIKHAKASNIYLSVINNDDTVKLAIKDDGIGFDPTRKSKGVGLMNIKARASLFNGKVNILSEKEKGCELNINFKLKATDCLPLFKE